jgi:hypothetical protein
MAWCIVLVESMFSRGRDTACAVATVVEAVPV